MFGRITDAVIASVAKQPRVPRDALGCFATLARTGSVAFVSPQNDAEHVRGDEGIAEGAPSDNGRSPPQDHTSRFATFSALS